MNPKKIIKEYNGIGRIDSCNLPDVEVRFCQYSDGEIKGEVKNINDRHVAEFWNSMKDFPPLTIRGNISSGDSFVFHSFYAAHPTTELVGKDFEVTRIGVVEDYQKYDFEIQFGLLQLSLFQPIKCNPKCDPSFNEFIISPVQNIKEILEEIKASKVCDVTCHISFTFTSGKENLEKKIAEIVHYLEGVMILLSFAQGVFINFIYYDLYIKHAGGFELYKSVHNTAKTKITIPDELIWTPHIQNFLESVLPTFTKDFQERTGVGDAIEWYLESIRPSVIESKFIHACIAIELLNDRFKEKKNKGKGGILTDVEFKNFDRDIRKVIKKHIPSDKIKRQKMYPKIRELNRPTLQNSLEDMYNFYAIGYSDHFPKFGFITIRNKIVHTGLSKSDFKDLRENYEKLVVLLQRTLLGMLNYTGEFIDQSDNWKRKKFKKENGLKTELELQKNTTRKE